MSRWLLLAWLIPTATYAQTIASANRTDLLMENAKRLVAVDADGCLLNRADDEIVVCGMAEIDRQQRLPFPELVVDPDKRIREPMPTGNPQIVQQGRCYVTMNERNCFKGVPIMSVSFGGSGGDVSGPAGRLWRFVEPPVHDDDFVKQVQIRSNGTK